MKRTAKALILAVFAAFDVCKLFTQCALRIHLFIPGGPHSVNQKVSVAGGFKSASERGFIPPLIGVGEPCCGEPLAAACRGR